MTRYASAFLLAIASLQAVSAGRWTARAADVQEVIPGPGLPSLESLGITSADLYNMPLPEDIISTRSASYTLKCGPGVAYTDVQSIIACYKYLNSIPTTDCGVTASGTPEFVRSGKAHVTGESYRQQVEHSYCRNVASGLLGIINSCTRPQQDVAGFNAAAGNGNLIVGASNINYD